MCLSTPKMPSVPERQAVKQPELDVSTRLSDRDRRRRGYAATMFAGSTGPASTTNTLGA